jgi:hypothetical protein
MNFKKQLRMFRSRVRARRTNRRFRVFGISAYRAGLALSEFNRVMSAIPTA